MRRLATALLGAALAAALAAAPASAEFGFKEVELTLSGPPPGAPALQAGAHPFAMRTMLEMNTVPVPEEECEFPECEAPEGAVRDLIVDLPEGLAVDPRAVDSCSAAQFIEIVSERPSCPDSAAVGFISLRIDFQLIPKGTPYLHVPLYSLAPPPGRAARFGFVPLGVPVTFDGTLNPDPPYNPRAESKNIPQATVFYGAAVTLWGDPASPAHDALRGSCMALNKLGPEPTPTGEECPVQSEGRRPLFTTPRSCTGPLETRFLARSWPVWALDGKGELLPGPSESAGAIALTEPGMVGCPKLGFAPRISARPTTESAESPSGLAFDLRIEDPGLTNPAEGATALSDIRKAVVTLPEGMTVNPSQAEGLETCSEAELARESLDSQFGEGCPAASKIGSVEVETPLLEDEVLRGQLYVAEPRANRFGSLLAIYQVIRDRELGLLVKLAGKVEPDPRTGQLVTTFDDVPQLPFSDFRLRFREGGRSPLVTPPGCGDYEVEARFTPWAAGVPARTETATFEIGRGPGGGPCPPGGPPPFEPGFAAGSTNPVAGAHSPFHMRLTRRDGDQDLTRFDAVLPPGVTAKLAGVPWCPDAAIAAAKGRDGTDELASPSCPAVSQIGSVQGGAGVGSQLTYVPGKIYLAGPVGGAPLSVVGIVPAVAGPFDVGTIVVRQALRLDPITGQAKVDGAVSDPLPHILAGIPLRVRDIQVNVDRPDFTLNPTSCAEMATLAGIWGGGSHVFSTADDLPVLRQARFQVAGCRGMGFKPKLAIKLKGGVRRGAHPALRAHVVPRAGDANFARAVVKLPRSAFLDQGHIRTICTRVQFAAGPGNGAHCPKGARYGFARAWSPLLDAPATGPVYLRSSDNDLPDLVVALTGPPSAQVEVELSARIDSVRGGIRSTFATIPDFPVSRFILDMQGGRKGLIVNSRHLCRKPKRNRAQANLRGQNGKLSRTRPRVVAVKCQKRRKAKRRAKRSVARLGPAGAVG